MNRNNNILPLEMVIVNENYHLQYFANIFSLFNYMIYYVRTDIPYKFT